MGTPSKIRLYVEQKLTTGTSLILNEQQSHYLCNVMRLKNGSYLSCFNSTDGELRAYISCIHKKQTEIHLEERVRCPIIGPDVWLLFSPIKKDRMDFLVEKSVELGVSALLPVITQYGITDKLKSERVCAQIIDAAEQCERLDVPKLLPTDKLANILKHWNPSRRLFFMDERGVGQDCVKAFSNIGSEKSALLIGPEGGFSDAEAEMLYSQPFVVPVSLGPRILRAETAVVAALSVWQAIAGDWKNKENRI